MIVAAMRNLAVLLGVWGLVVLLSCSRSEQAQEGAGAAVVHEEQPFAGLVSVVNVADPKAAGQLLKGWHQVEQASWRWTEKQFSVALKTPAGGGAATLEMKLALPEALIARLQSVTLAATVNGAALAPETWNKPGEQVYTRGVPAEALKGEVTRADFTLDKALPPDTVDRRELGVIVSSVRLE